jgi:hypothetical protein
MQWRALGSRLLERKPAFHELGGGIAFPDGPLARAEHAHARRPLVLERSLELFGHGVKGLVPAHGGELAVLVVHTVFHAQERLGQAVLPVHDLGQEVALDAVQAAVHFGARVALGGDHLAGFHADHDAAAGAAKTAGGLGPVEVVEFGIGDGIGRQGGQFHASSAGGCHGGGVAQKTPAGNGHGEISLSRSAADSWRWYTRVAPSTPSVF